MILLTGDDSVQALNARFRGKDSPTNVLSFPAPEREGYPGDVALAFGVCAREAQAAGKPLIHHAAHLALHGVLHLNGLDHEEEIAAREMEAAGDSRARRVRHRRPLRRGGRTMTDTDTGSGLISRFTAVFRRAPHTNGDYGTVLTDSPSGQAEAPAPGGDLFLNLREFHAKRVEDVMVPRADIIAVEIDTPPQGIGASGDRCGPFALSGLSRDPR